ncbi:MAG: helix-turn-helix domain-containing protein [Rhodocyclaceae bacterium]
MNEAQTTGVAAVDRAFLILSAFQEGDVSLTLAILARRTGLYKSTILRLMQSLIRAGFVLRLPDGNYAVGTAATRLSRLQHPAAA